MTHTTCIHVALGFPCGEPTRAGRSRCEEHRKQLLRKLSLARQEAMREFERIDDEYQACLKEGYSA